MSIETFADISLEKYNSKSPKRYLEIFRSNYQDIYDKYFKKKYWSESGGKGHGNNNK